MKIILRHTIQKDVDELKETIRESDIEECEVLTGLNKDEGIQQTIDCCKDCFTGLDNKGRVLGIYGVSIDRAKPLTYGIVFFLGSKYSDNISCKKYLLKEGKVFISAMLQKYEVLWNVVIADRVQTLKWLKYLGFTISEPFIYNGCECKSFQIRREG